MDNGGTVKEATESSKITLATYYKYKRLFGDNEPNEKGLVEIIPQKQSVKQLEVSPSSSKEKELELIIKENSALREQIALRQELAKLVQ